MKLHQIVPIEVQRQLRQLVEPQRQQQQYIQAFAQRQAQAQDRAKGSRIIIKSSPRYRMGLGN